MSANRNRKKSDLKRLRIDALLREGKSLAQIVKITGWSYAAVRLLAGQTRAAQEYGLGYMQGRGAS